MIQLGIVGSHYGCTVLLPAFQAAGGFAVAALAGQDPARTRERAQKAGIRETARNWRELVEHSAIEAVVIAVPPRLQPEIAAQALACGKAVFAEKPIGADVAGAERLARQAATAGRPVMIDFEFPELPAWKGARQMLDAGAVGALRHVSVSWMVETYATRMRLKNWKTSAAAGGGVIGNLACHAFHYLEWFCGPLASLSAHLSGLPGEAEPSESTASLAGTFASGASVNLSVSAAAYLGSGHRLEFYGNDGTLVLANPTTDYMRGFTLYHARRPTAPLAPVSVAPDPADAAAADGRIAPVRQLAIRFRAAIAHGHAPVPGLREALRVQRLIEAARRSHAEGGRLQPVDRREVAA